MKKLLATTYLITATALTVSMFSACAIQTELIIGEQEPESPRLIIGITIDQMKAEYLHRFSEHFSSGGFNRIIEGGFSCNDHHFGYAPTFTGPGHASIFTGTTPAVHGIVANNWYVRDIDKSVYCASDPNFQGVGNKGVSSDGLGDVFGTAGQMSPSRLVSNTVGDELKLASGLNSKVIGVSLKDRGAVLPAGHAADGAFWFYGGDLGHFISSTYYGPSLPDWAIEFNNKGTANNLVSEGWELLLPSQAYSSCLPDNNPYEGSFKGETRPVFPYDLEALMPLNGGLDIIKGTPAGNTILVDFALAAIEGELLGKDNYCDMLTLSFSATDYVGHRCGPNSIETMDMYIRLDLELERFFNSLDEIIGVGNWTVFITSDHGAATVPSHAASIGMPTDYWSPGNMQERIELELDERFGAQYWISNISNNQIFINPIAVRSAGVNDTEVQKLVSKLTLEEDAILHSISEEDLASRAAVDPIASRLYNGHLPGTSGEVLFTLKPGWLIYGRTGTTHGSPFSYDTHVPCLFYGAGVNPGSTYVTTHIRDIAPTVSALLKIPYPNGTTGSPIAPVLKN